MSLLSGLTGKIEPRSENWAAEQFHRVIAQYGRTRHVQPWTPESAGNPVAVPEEPLGSGWFLRS